MKHALFASAIFAGLGFVASTLPSAALPMNAGGLAGSAHADVIQVRMHRRHRMRQGSASRGNASMPSRGASAQQYGGTTGGPRR